MKTMFSFARAETALARAASDGAASAAELLARSLADRGTPAIAQAAGAGASVTVAGAGAVAREFGTRNSPARPVLGPAVAENRAAMVNAVGQSRARALRGAP